MNFKFKALFWYSSSDTLQFVIFLLLAVELSIRQNSLSTSTTDRAGGNFSSDGTDIDFTGSKQLV